MLKESEVASYEHQDDSYIDCQAFPEPVSEEQEIYGDYHRYKQHDIERGRCVFVHLSRHQADPEQMVCQQSSGDAKVQI